MRTYLFAYFWHCGDHDNCNCYQPVVERVETRPEHVDRVTRLWEGSFRSQPTKAEGDEMVAQLRAAAERFGIALDPISVSGTKAVDG